jgi:transcriptional regulator with XRE-family HTH domain
MSQSRLADALGVSFQQVQKYERGANRVSASTLYDAAKILTVEIAYFFEDAEALPRSADAKDNLMHSFWLSREGPEFARLFGVIPAKERRALLEFARTLAHLARPHSRSASE